ncbi:MAG: LamG domain-containing protein, partial [Vicinamibacterales bacterium]
VGAWHHVAVSYDGRGGATAANGIQIYIDGVAAPMVRQNSATYVAMRNTTAPLSIGREGPSWYQFDGGMDDVRVWSVTRSAAEIAGARSTELTGSESGLVGYWRFNGGSGTSAVNDATTGAGTLTNGVVWVGGGPLS